MVSSCVCVCVLGAASPAIQTSCQPGGGLVDEGRRSGRGCLPAGWPASGRSYACIGCPPPPLISSWCMPCIDGAGTTAKCL